MELATINVRILITVRKPFPKWKPEIFETTFWHWIQFRFWRNVFIVILNYGCGLTDTLTMHTPKTTRHSVWKSLKKVAFNIASYGATFTFWFWIDKSSWKMPKIISRVFENWSLRSNSVTRQVTLKGQKLVKTPKITNVTFWVDKSYLKIVNFGKF